MANGKGATHSTTSRRTQMMDDDDEEQQQQQQTAQCQPQPQTTATVFPVTLTGMNIILRSAFLRMTLVGTSTVLFVTAIVFFAIGISELMAPDGVDDRTEPVVLAIGGVLLMITSIVQFMCICVWSGWCSLLNPSGRAPPGDFLQFFDGHNQILVNGQLISVQALSTTTTTGGGQDILRPSETTNGRHQEKVRLLEKVDNSKLPTKMVADASTSTRGEVCSSDEQGDEESVDAFLE